MFSKYCAMSSKTIFLMRPYIPWYDDITFVCILPNVKTHLSLEINSYVDAKWHDANASSWENSAIMSSLVSAVNLFACHICQRYLDNISANVVERGQTAPEDQCLQFLPVIV